MGVVGAVGSHRRRVGVALGLAGMAVPLAVAVAGPAQAQARPLGRSAGTVTPVSMAASSCTTTAGPYQQQAERFLGRPVDGRQSRADCLAIQKFQIDHGISPTIGYAGPITSGVMSLISAQKAAGHNPNAAKKCPVNKGRIACVDLTRQLSWVQDGSRLVYGPVPVRSGRDGFETRTGLKRIYWRNINHWSTLYKVAMPYSQFFDGGQAFHSIDGSVWSPPGSHGCVNMRKGEAKKYWSLLKNGDDVYVYGRKPGT
ncbi:L,D-transpeptidase [Streptomyces sp. MK37H]|uniref:L,D-transpeptidase n=1 Tax=Streptomyces sp. MK37H TaxID=2699117 RepID=UPI001B36BE73|nr:L,D-transpeptidase [Streptomyces sp. MK37H]MBP8536596.1 L,D-transpeptidase family protein [Streptomyces sp. MK37H]